MKLSSITTTVNYQQKETRFNKKLAFGWSGKLPTNKFNEVIMHNAEKMFNPSGLTDIENLKQKYIAKIKVMPLIMDRTLYDVANYMNNKINTDKFAEYFTNDVSSLTKRINLGKDSLEYKENYKPELTLIKEINSVCNKFYENLIEQKILDNTVERSVSKYVDNNTVRKKNFIA